MQQENPLNTVNFSDESINIREEIEKYAYHWKWFVLTVVVALTTAFLFLRYSTNIYEVSTTILIDEENRGGLASELSAFEDLGLLGGRQTTLDNEIELLKSRTLMGKVIKDLGLNVAFYNKGRVKTSELFYQNSPIKINFFSKDSLFYLKDTTFIVKINSETNFSLLNVTGELVSGHVFGESIHSALGDITITPADGNKLKGEEEIIVKITQLKKVVDRYRNAIQIQPINKNASVIKLSLKDQLRFKAQVILNRLVYQYNKDAVEDKSKVAKNTNEFINQRLEIINKDLLAVESNAETFKSVNKLTDIASEAGLNLASKSEFEKRIVELGTQLKLIAYVGEYLETNSEDLIPANLGLSEGALEASTLKYNELLLERNRILKSSSKLNPVIVNLNEQIIQLKESISQSLVNLKSSLTISLNEVMQQQNRLNFKIAAVPKQEREYRDIQRQQQIIEALYLYLLEKREENAITLAVTLPNAKVIDSAYGSDIPVAPKRKIIYLAALLLGVIVPFVVLYILFLLDNKVHTRKDVEAVLTIPILGDIPNTTSSNKVVVSDQDRSNIAEAFRLLRTNIDFMFSKVQKESKTVFLTSSISGEGKTFIAINLASVLALSKKRVLLIGADIRSPKIIDYLGINGDKGLTHFLRDTNLKTEDIVIHISDYEFDMIHSGIIPPNPAELLMNGRFEEIMEYANQNYDYVIVDTAPVNLVTDTLLLSEYADLFIYIIRANYLDKRLLELPNMLHKEERLKNMAILLNGLDSERGYGYGYGYGGDDKKPSSKKRILDFFKK